MELEQFARKTRKIEETHSKDRKLHDVADMKLSTKAAMEKATMKARYVVEKMRPILTLTKLWGV